jgi:hypothetical protein
VKTYKSIQNKKPLISVKGELHKIIPHVEKGRSLNIVHASDVVKSDWCPRKVALMQELKVKPPTSFIGTSLQTTFDDGRDFESQLTNKWLKLKVVGGWHCLSCNDVKINCKYPKGHCGRRGITCNWVYTEAVFTSVECGVSCSIDLLLDLNQSKLLLIETKIIVKDTFKKLEAPVAEHRLRTSLYLRLIAESGTLFSCSVNTNKAYILYKSRGFGIKDTEIRKYPGVKDASFSPFKEFIIKRNDEDTQNIVNRARCLLGFKNKKGYPGGVCPSIHCDTANKCPVRQSCFSGDFPVQLTWLEDGVKKHDGLKIY